VVLVWTFYLLPERREGGRGGATGEQGTSSRRQQELQYRTEQRQEGGWEREGAMPSQRERAVKDKTEQSGFFNKGRERREEGEREK
jgi:hypothetical protein